MRVRIFGGVTMRLVSLVLAMALTSSAALAGDAKPLAPGAPAGVKKAQLAGIDNGLLIVLGVAVVVGIAVAASSGDSKQTPAPPVTTS
jgi:hypothetical protein